jgi:hopanoid biosynthesis associated protein HpnK
MESRPRTLVVNADDFGLSEQINRGIESAFDRGILRSTSIMPNGNAFDDAVRIAAATRGLGVGIHLSLVDEQCSARLAAVSGLADAQGRLPKHANTFLLLWSLRRFDARQIQAEVRAQISRVLEAGIKPTHLDSHQHLHLFPPVLTVVLAEAASAGIPVVRLPIDCSQGRGIRADILARLSRRALPRLRALGIRSADCFWGLAHSGCMNETNILRVLVRLQYGVNELMCHPGFSDPATRARYPWRYHWDEETFALTSSRIRAYVHGHNIRLANFRDAWEA